MECPACTDELEVPALLVGFDDEFDCPVCGTTIDVQLQARVPVARELDDVRSSTLRELVDRLLLVGCDEADGKIVNKKSMTDDEQAQFGVCVRRLAAKLIMVPQELHEASWPTLGRSLGPALALFRQGTLEAIEQGTLSPLLRAAVDEVNAPLPRLWLERVWDLIPGTAWREPPTEGREVYSAAVLAYLAGNDLGSIGMARAVIDVRVKQAMYKLGYSKRKTKEKSFNERLTTIQERRPEIRADLETPAMALWRLGNGTLHAGEIQEGDAREALDNLATVLEVLARVPTDEAITPDVDHERAGQDDGRGTS